MKTLKNKIVISLCVAALLVVTSYRVNAQDGKAVPEDVYTPKIEFGVRFMPTFSSFKMETSTGGSVSGEVILGFGAGALIGYNFNSHIELQAELIYSTISQKYAENEVERKINLRYVNIPLLLSINTSKYKAVNLNVVVGPQVGILVGSTVYTSGSDGTDPNAILAVKKTDLGLAYGLGLDFGLNRMHTIRLGVGFRGSYGLVNISKDNQIEVPDSYYILSRTHVQTYAAYAGVSFLF